MPLEEILRGPTRLASVCRGPGERDRSYDAGARLCANRPRGGVRYGSRALSGRRTPSRSTRLFPPCLDCRHPPRRAPPPGGGYGTAGCAPRSRLRPRLPAGLSLDDPRSGVGDFGLDLGRPTSPRAEDRPRRSLALAAPDTLLGSHFAYALQWWMTVPVAFPRAVMARQQAQEESGLPARERRPRRVASGEEGTNSPHRHPVWASSPTGPPACALLPDLTPVWSLSPTAGTMST